MTKPFRKIADIPVARYTGSFDSALERTLVYIAKLFRSTEQNEINPGHVTRTFDWDGEYLYTPCDCELAANVWSISNKNKVSRLGTSSESLATMYAYQFGEQGEAIFGNRGQLLYCNNAGHVQRLNIQPLDHMDSIKVAKDKRRVFFIEESGGQSELVAVEKGSSSSIDRRSFVVRSGQAVDPSGIFHLCVCEPKEENSYLVLYTKIYCGKYVSEEKDLYVMKMNYPGKVKHRTISGIHAIAGNPKKAECIVLGRTLALICLETLKIIKEAELTGPRDVDYYFNNVICFSPCGGYVAVSYNADGDIEIRDAVTLKVVKTLSNNWGFPQADIAWDVSGQFLACRMHSVESGVTTLVVWDTRTGAVCLQDRSSPTDEVPVAFRWSPYSSCIANLVDCQRIALYQQ